MKSFLMFKDQDFDLEQAFPQNADELTKDLELNILFNAMSRKDEFLFTVAKKVLLSGLSNNKDTILYRQNILKDCIANPSIVRDIYAITLEPIEKEKNIYSGLLGKYPNSIMHRSIQVLKIFVEMLKKLKKISYNYADNFKSEGFSRLFSMLGEELNDDYIDSIENHLKQLNSRNGVLISAKLGKGNKGIHYLLRKPNARKSGLIKQIFTKKPPVYSYTLADRDDSGSRALSELKDRGINRAANALAQATDHILHFFEMMRTEMSFYIGSLNLHEQMVKMGLAMTFPIPASTDEYIQSYRELYDISLALTMKQKIVGNNLNAHNKDLIIITGANQGGKSTFLRSIGLAQLMMQSGMFVPAEFYSSSLFSKLFTHYKREEDTSMNSGKLDEELKRMSSIIDNINATSLVLFNESFAATNEKEGSEIANQISSALLDKRIKIFFVTHLYEFAHGIYNRKTANTLFLRAERESDGVRTFKIIEGEPLQTSYAEDLYKKLRPSDMQGLSSEKHL